MAGIRISPAAQGRSVPEQPEKAVAEARRTRALQLQSTPEYLDALYLAVDTGPNIAYLRNGWKNWNAYVERRQARARSELQPQVQSVVSEAQKQLFKQIGSHGFYDHDEQCPEGRPTRGAGRIGLVALAKERGWAGIARGPSLLRRSPP